MFSKSMDVDLGCTMRTEHCLSAELVELRPQLDAQTVLSMTYEWSNMGNHTPDTLVQEH